MIKGKVVRGFKPFNKAMEKSNNKLKQIRRCDNCKHYHAGEENSEEEYCHNNGVTSYDMTYEEDKQYCTFWTPSWIKD